MNQQELNNRVIVITNKLRECMTELDELASELDEEDAYTVASTARSIDTHLSELDEMIEFEE